MFVYDIMSTEREEEFVINPLTRRRIRVGSAVHKRLVKAGHFGNQTPQTEQVSGKKCRSLKAPKPKGKELKFAEGTGGGEDFAEYDGSEEAPEKPMMEREENVAKEDTAPIHHIVGVVLDTIILNRKAIADMSYSDKQIKKALFDAVMG